MAAIAIIAQRQGVKRSANLGSDRVAMAIAHDTGTLGGGSAVVCAKLCGLSWRNGQRRWRDRAVVTENADDAGHDHDASGKSDGARDCRADRFYGREEYAR